MPLVLVIESDPRQAAVLERLLRERVGADLVLVDSPDDAVTAIRARAPDLVLVPALWGPRDEAELMRQLRTLDAAIQVQTLVVPMLAPDAGEEPTRPRRWSWRTWLRRRSDRGLSACDPSAFADEVAGYLTRNAAPLSRALFQARAELSAPTAAFTTSRGAGLQACNARLKPCATGDERDSRPQLLR